MKVLHVIPSVGPLQGGPSYAALNTCRGLASIGVSVTLVTSDDNGPGHLDVPLETPVEQDGYTIIYFRRTTREYTFSWAITPWLLRHIHEFDFVHIHAVFSYTSVLAGILARTHRIPYAVRPAGILQRWGMRARRAAPKQLHYNIFEKGILNQAAFVQAMTSAEAKEIQHLGIGAPIEVIYHGLQPARPSPSAQPLTNVSDQAITFLFLGRLHPVKGLDLLLPAFAGALTQDARLVLLLAGDGDSSYKTWMRVQIDELGLADHVRWLGFLQSDAKWGTIAASTAVVMPSYSENFGMVVVEAMMCGTPIIVSEGVALAPEVAAASAGIVIPCEVEALMQAILHLAQNAEARAVMRANARILAENKFRLDRVTKDLIGAYTRYGRK